jgi:hypothetical protein
MLLVITIKIICIFVMSVSVVGMVNCIATERQITLGEVMTTAIATTVFITLQWFI